MSIDATAREWARRVLRLLSDGDKGDITLSSGGSAWTIDNGAVTLAKQADMATASVVYRKTAGAGAPEVQTIATLKTDLGLTGTNSGDQTSIVGITGTKAQFDTAVTDGNILYVGDVTQYTDEMAQDAVGGMVDASLTYVDATPLLQRAALTGAVTASAGSNATSLGSFTIAQLSTAVSDADLVTTASGTYTPTATTILNVDSITAAADCCQYMRVGSVVTVSGRVTIDATASGTYLEASLTLPVASGLTAASQCAGTMAAVATSTTNAGAVYGGTTDDVAILRIVPQSTAATVYHFTFTYLIV